MTIGKFILGMFFVGVGFMFVWKTEWLMINFGRIPFAEKYLSTIGGSRMMYKVYGTLIIMVGFAYATNQMDEFLAWAIKSIFGPQNPTN